MSSSLAISPHIGYKDLSAFQKREGKRDEFCNSLQAQTTRIDDRNQIHISTVDHIGQKTLLHLGRGETSASEKTLIGLSILDASSSLTRQVLRVIPPIGPDHYVVKNLGILSSVLGLLISGFVSLANGLFNFKKSSQIGDEEGVRNASADMVSGTVSLNTSACTLATAFAAPSLAALGIASDALYALGSLINLGIAGRNIYLCVGFRSEMDQILNSKRLSKKERIVQTLQFLKSKVSPTDLERAAIVKEVERLHPDSSPQVKREEIQRRTINLAQVKIQYIQRRTGQAITVRLVEEIDQHLQNLRHANPDEKSLRAAEQLIEEIRRQNKKKIFFSAIVASASLIALIALVLGSCFSLGVLPFILYAIASAIGLALLLYPLISDNMYRSKSEGMASRAIALAPVTVAVN